MKRTLKIFQLAKSAAKSGAKSIATDEARRASERLKNLAPVIAVTTDHIPTYLITELFGPVRGSTVRAKNIARDLLADVKGFVGGEIKGCAELLSEAREEALYRMKLDAEELGARYLGTLGIQVIVDPLSARNDILLRPLYS